MLVFLRTVLPTDRPEAFVQVPRVQQRPCLPGLVQGGPHDLVPQGGVQADDLWNVAEQFGGLHLGEQAALLQVQQPALEQLQRGEGEKKTKKKTPGKTLTQKVIGSLTRRAALRAPVNASSRVQTQELVPLLRNEAALGVMVACLAVALTSVMTRSFLM